MRKYAKGIVATVIAAICTSVGVIWVSNDPKPPAGVTGQYVGK